MFSFLFCYCDVVTYLGTLLYPFQIIRDARDGRVYVLGMYLYLCLRLCLCLCLYWILFFPTCSWFSFAEGATRIFAIVKIARPILVLLCLWWCAFCLSIWTGQMGIYSSTKAGVNRLLLRRRHVATHRRRAEWCFEDSNDVSGKCLGRGGRGRQIEAARSLRRMANGIAMMAGQHDVLDIVFMFRYTFFPFISILFRGSWGGMMVMVFLLLAMPFLLHPPYGWHFSLFAAGLPCFSFAIQPGLVGRPT